MVQQQNHQQYSQNDYNNQNRVASLKGGGGDEAWPPQNSSLRVKRPMLGGRRIIGGPSTPVPRWKLYENPFYDGIAAAAAAAAQQQQQQHNSTKGGGGGRSIAVSARKLAATLWELQEFPFSVAAAAASSKTPTCPCVQHRSSFSSSSKKTRNHLLTLAERNNSSNHASPSPPHPAFFHNQQAVMAKESMVSLQHPNKAWESVKRNSQSQSTSSRQNAALRSHVHRLFKERADARLTQLAQPKPNSYPVLSNIRDKNEHHTAATQSSVVAALQMELERVRTRAHELELAHKKARREIDNLLKRVTEEKLVLRNREQEKIRSAVQSVKVEADEEKKARRRIESVNRKMSRELVDANITIAEAVQELEKERKARELMEDVCNELAREIGEDKQEVEELKRESAKVREEVEEERKMLQMAEVWREERVQMKLAEARLDIEEKNMILDNLRDELVTFLKSRKALLHSTEDDEETCIAVVQEAEGLKAALDALQIRDVDLSNSYRSRDTDEEAPGLRKDEQRAISSRSSRPDNRENWRWGAQATRGYGESESRIATKDEVLDRLRKKWEQSGQNSSIEGGHEGDGSGKWQNERGDASEWNSQSEHQGDDTKEEDGSQWESASDQDILDAIQHGNSTESSQGGSVGMERQSEPQASAALHSSPYDKRASKQAFIVKPAAELSLRDDLWRASTPLAGAGRVMTEERRSSGEGSRSFHARGISDLSRSAHMRLTTEQGIASPSRDWRSPDRGNPHIAMGIKGFIEWPKMYRENGGKGKAFESKGEKVDRQMLKQSS